MSIRFLPLILISSFVFAQEDTAQPSEPIITDLDRLVESVKKTASSRSAEDNARLQRFLADKNRQQYLLNQMKANLKDEENRSARLTKEYEDNDARLADLEEQADAGIFPPEFVYDHVINQLSDFINYDYNEHPLYTQFLRKVKPTINTSSLADINVLHS